MRLLVVGILAVGLGVPWVAHAQSVSLPRNCHPWGRFKPGVWSQVRKITEEFDEAGNVKTVSTTETKTTLLEASDTQCKLSTEVVVEVAGKLFTPQPKTVVVGYNGETNSQVAAVTRTGNAELEVGERKVACVQLEATIDAGDRRLVSTIYYANTVPPYVLKRVSQTLASDGQPLPAQSTVEVIAADMPYAVLNETRSCAFVRTVNREAKALACTVEVFCVDVPGGVVSHTSRETDERGRLVRRSTLELLDFGTADDRKPTNRGGLFFHRPRPRRTTGSWDP